MMSLTDAKKYIDDLHKRQENPLLWPDFLTGLPGKSAIIKQLDKAYPNLGTYAVAYIRIANIHPYLIKYGPDRHAEIIQWAAAILKTSCEKCAGCFIATVSTHDFVIICKTKTMSKHLKDVMKTFDRKVETFYTAEDRKSRTILSFIRSGEKVTIGLIKMIAVVTDSDPGIEKSQLIREMGKACDGLAAGSQNILNLSAFRKG
ncbi:MAG: hypothetical protein EPN25_01415 [Nitrospirae bacterium]|nr:MAG: hypothetical protein EPN25_01415 [Nitrospirota bacterium]